eukprot:scaffold11.g3998.t1
MIPAALTKSSWGGGVGDTCASDGDMWAGTIARQLSPHLKRDIDVAVTETLGVNMEKELEQALKKALPRALESTLPQALRRAWPDEEASDRTTSDNQSRRFDTE